MTRVLSGSMSSRGRWTRIALVWFVLSTAMLVWPIFPWLGNHVHPRVLGLPWSLVYVLLVVAANAVALGLLVRFRILDDREADELEEDA